MRVPSRRVSTGAGRLSDEIFEGRADGRFGDVDQPDGRAVGMRAIGGIFGVLGQLVVTLRNAVVHVPNLLLLCFSLNLLETNDKGRPAAILRSQNSVPGTRRRFFGSQNSMPGTRRRFSGAKIPCRTPGGDFRKQKIGQHRMRGNFFGSGKGGHASAMAWRDSLKAD